MTKRYMILIAVLCAMAICCQGAPLAFEIDLDADPLHRYDEVVRYFAAPLDRMDNKMMQRVPWYMNWALSLVYGTVVQWFYPEYVKEIKGIAREMKVSESTVYILNSIYEAEALCTSIVARDPAGVVMIARHLDFSLAKYLRDLHYLAIYKRGGVRILECSTLAASVGVFTCQRPQAFALSLNMRYTKSLAEMLWRFVQGYPSVTWVMRDAVLQATTYQQLVALISKAQTIGKSYVTVAGMRPNEGAILTRDPDKVVDIRELNETVWYLAQCNQDHWKAKDQRTLHTNARMQLLGPSRVSLLNIANEVLLRAPVLMKSNVVTVFMVPRDSYLRHFKPTCACEYRIHDEPDLLH